MPQGVILSVHYLLSHSDPSHSIHHEILTIVNRIGCVYVFQSRPVEFHWETLEY